jgi:phenylpyruvate tautomerase PptA (4-oxalocrotonate tautomerase family)
MELGAASRPKVLQHRRGEKNTMIHVKLTDDVFAPEQKRKVIAELTRVIVSVKGNQPVTLVVIEEEACEADVVFC